METGHIKPYGHQQRSRYQGQVIKAQEKGQRPTPASKKAGSALIKTRSCISENQESYMITTR